MFGCIRRRVCSVLHRAMPLLALAGFVAGAMGLPVPQVVFTAKDRRQPFPCLDRRCGCMSADQCWRGCCCFTNREKVAWAAQRGVTPPEFVVRLAARERAPAAAQSCCAAKKTPDCSD